ncbi:MAG TPA: glutaminyl-peptide cyclotransferase [Phnomibacter sp.]|nr:glutaminyl-peptide cyclotransferase [Phnomibacter sp.]
MLSYIKKLMISRSIIFALSLIILFGCNCNPEIPGIVTGKKEDMTVFIPESPGYRVIAEYPHDTAAYTQGLIWHNGHLLEGTGQFGKSDLRVVDLTTGKVLKQTKNAEDVFGEGITYLNGKIYQVTWQNKKGFIYDAKTLKPIGEFPLNTQGWGLTTNGSELILSDGSNVLYFLDTATFREQRRVGVSDNFGPVGNLNELEWVNGFVFANRWQSDMIYKINPESGRVEARIDFSGLKEQAGFNVNDPSNEVLNGIAYDSVNNRFFITGKYWPRLFEVKIGQ